MPKQSHRYTVYLLWQQLTRVFSHANGFKGVECHPTIHCIRCRNSVMVLAGSGERKVTATSCPIRVQLARDLGLLLARAVLYTTKRTLQHNSRMWTCVVLLKKHFTFLSKKWQYHGFNNLCSVADTIYLTLHEHQLWPRFVTNAPHPEAWGGAYVSWTNALRKMTLTRSTPYMWTTITRIQTEPTLITEDFRAPFDFPLNSFSTPDYPCLPVLWCKW